MPIWLLILFAVLMGACDDTVVGGIRQLNTNPNLTIISSVDNGDVWVAEEVTLDTQIPDSTTAPDTALFDTTEEVDTGGGVDTAAETDTVIPDSVSVTIEDTVVTVDTGVPETVEDTTPILDTADTVVVVDTTPPECSVHFDCNDNNDCTHDYCVNFSCVHEDNTLCVMDTDGDGIVDIEDECPLEPEYFDLYDDEDGCPEEDQDHDGWSSAEGDCEDNPSTWGDPASFCWNEVDGFHLMIHFGADERPTCDYYSEDGEFIEGVLLFETNGVFLIGPQIQGNDTPDDNADNDCDGQTDEAGEYGLSPPDCYWDSFDDGSEVVWCWWMDDLYEL